MKKLKIISVILLSLFISCDIIENPVHENTGNTCGDETTGIPIKKILVEDFTGQRCLNCPQAAVILVDIISNYCDHIVPVAIHTTAFADSTEEFPYNYKTIVGDELANDYGIISLPMGLINRTEFNGNMLQSRDNWLAAVNSLYNVTPEMNIIIESSYNETTNKITAVVTTEFLADFNYDINLGLYLTEDSIISPQQNGADIISDYIHRHMLRKGITSTYGEKIASSGNFGEFIQKTFVFDADPKWILGHCELVAFISKNTTNEIIQAESEPIIEE
jgi:hypothetical protein